MSSEDEYYTDRYDYRYDRYSSKKARRRGSSPRRRQTDSDCFRRKSRRSKHRSTAYIPRVVAVVILVVLIAYEIVVLSFPSYSRRTSVVRESDEKEAMMNPKQNSLHTSPVTGHSDSKPAIAHVEASSETGFKSSGLTKSGGSSSAASPNNVQPNMQSATAQQDGKNEQTISAVSNEKSASRSDTKPNASNNSPPKTMSRHLPQSAIKMETRGADEDPDIDSRFVRRRSSRSGKGNPRHSETDDSKTEDASEADKGAEPGAGENFWNWFQETKGNDKKGVSESLPCPEDHKRLCQMFYKYLRKYKIRRIFDVSCEKNYQWMGNILKKAGNELWGFKYYCSIWSGEKAEDARRLLGGLPFVEFDDAKWWRAGFPSDTELLFAWDTLAHLAYGRVWNFFVKAKKQNIKYILVDNYPGILNDPSPKRDYLNLRKHPFRFPSAKEVAQNITEPGETSKRQLLFYETTMLPENLQ